jgi:inner membrane protein involved in colicin E2 resistance
VSYTIIHIPNMSSSNEIKSFVVVFIPLQLTMRRIVERRGDHICLLYDLPDGTSLTQKIVTSLVLPITEVFTIEDHKLHCTFLHVAFRSQNLLEPTSDRTGSDTN